MFKKIQIIPRVKSKALSGNTIRWEIPSKVLAIFMLVDNVGYMFLVKVKKEKSYWWNTSWKSFSTTTKDPVTTVLNGLDFLKKYNYTIDSESIEFAEKIGEPSYFSNKNGVSEKKEVNVVCSICGNEQKSSIYTEMDVSFNAELKQEFLLNKWNTFVCNKCKNITQIPLNMMYCDIPNNIIVWYTPNKINSNKEIYSPKPIIVKNRENFLLMVHLCSKNGFPKSENEISNYFQIIKEMRNVYNN